MRFRHRGRLPLLWIRARLRAGCAEALPSSLLHQLTPPLPDIHSVSSSVSRHTGSGAVGGPIDCGCMPWRGSPRTPHVWGWVGAGGTVSVYGVAKKLMPPYPVLLGWLGGSLARHTLLHIVTTSEVVAATTALLEGERKADGKLGCIQYKQPHKTTRGTTQHLGYHVFVRTRGRSML